MSYIGEKPEADKEACSDHDNQNNEILVKGSFIEHDPSIDDLIDEDLEQLPHSQQEDMINFQGATFYAKLSRIVPVEVQRGDVLPQFDNLIGFL